MNTERIVNVREIESSNEITEVAYEKSQVNPKRFYLFTKRAFDIIFSLIGLVILSPVFLIIAILIRVDSKGPAFFKHKRIGKNGKEIYIYKFRSMVQNAEELIETFTPEELKEFKENYKLANDRRITKMGKLLRKTSIDELPQLINILKGDLSIIGPRPIVEDELEKYGPNKSKFLSVTPGLTGYWQVSGRSCTSYEDRINMELFYAENISFGLDMKIFFKTFVCVLKKEGAI